MGEHGQQQAPDAGRGLVGIQQARRGAKEQEMTDQNPENHPLDRREGETPKKWIERINRDAPWCKPGVAWRFDTVRAEAVTATAQSTVRALMKALDAHVPVAPVAWFTPNWAVTPFGYAEMLARAPEVATKFEPAYPRPAVSEVEMDALRFAAHALEDRGAVGSANSIRQLLAKFEKCPVTTPEKEKGT
jgi:hypothetical protein